MPIYNEIMQFNLNAAFKRFARKFFLPYLNKNLIIHIISIKN